MPAQYSENEIISALSVLGEPTRVRILILISELGRARSIDILPEFSVTQPTLSHHLNLMLENNLLVATPDGRCIYYSVNADMLKAISAFTDTLTAPPVVVTTPQGKAVAEKRTQVRRKIAKESATLKKTSSVPIPKSSVDKPDIDKLRKEKKKKDKKKDKDKKKKKK